MSLKMFLVIKSLYENMTSLLTLFSDSHFIRLTSMFTTNINYNKTPFSDTKENNELNIKTNDTAQKIVISKVFRYLILYLSIEHYGHLS